MNLGADRSNGDILLFLHGDTRLPKGFTGPIHQCFRNPRVVAGAFRLGLAPPLKRLRFY